MIFSACDFIMAQIICLPLVFNILFSLNLHSLDCQSNNHSKSNELNMVHQLYARVDDDTDNYRVFNSKAQHTNTVYSRLSNAVIDSQYIIFLHLASLYLSTMKQCH